MKQIAVPALAVLAMTSACATHPNKISAAYVSPLKYNAYDCDQIAMEQAAIERKANTLYQTLKGRNTNDKWMMGVGLAVAWPALFFMKGKNGQLQGEYAQLKGDYDALQTAMVQKKCGVAPATVMAPVVPATSTAQTTSAAFAPAQAPTSSGVLLIRANTRSGYCIAAPDDYVGAGTKDRPAITSAQPLCSSLGSK